MKAFKKIILTLLLLTTFVSTFACSSDMTEIDNNDKEDDDEKTSLSATEKNDSITTTYTDKPVSTPSANEIDPFDGLTLNYFGISPFCTVAVNNSKCDKAVQNYVEYSIDGEYFANGDTVTVTATIADSSGSYTLKSGCETKAFTVSDMPYYVESLDGLDVSELEKELNDYVTSQISFESKYTVFETNAWKFLDTYGDEANNWCNFFNIPYVKSNEAHLITLKARKISDFLSKDIKLYNSLRIIATCNAEASHQNSHKQWYGKGDIFVCFKIDNLIAYPDGKLGWGLSSPESCEFTCASSLSGAENVKSVNITAFSEDYNISSVSKNNWIDIKK